MMGLLDSSQCYAAAEVAAANTFAEMDRDNDGTVTLDEFRTHIMKKIRDEHARAESHQDERLRKIGKFEES